MSISSILLFGLAAVAAGLLGLGVVKHRAKAPVIVICAVVGVASIVLAVYGMRPTSPFTPSKDARECEYLGLRLLEEGMHSEALLELANVDTAIDGSEDASLLRALAYNQSGAFHLSCILLERLGISSSDDAKELYAHSHNAELASGDEVASICDVARSSIGVKDEERNSWDRELDVYLSKDSNDDTVSVAVSNDYRKDMRRALAEGNVTEAYRLVMTAARAGDPQADVILSEMYAEGIVGKYSNNQDSGFNALLRTLTEQQAKASEASTQEEYEAAMASIVLTSTSFEVEPCMRAIGDLHECDDVAGIYQSYYDLQLGSLYYRVGNLSVAKDHLSRVINASKTAESGSLLQIMHACVDAAACDPPTYQSRDFEIAIDQLMNFLYGGAIAWRCEDGFPAFLHSLIKEEMGAISIVGVAPSLPSTVNVVVQVREENDNDALSGMELIDTGTIVEKPTVKRVSENNDLAICFVLDASNSMSGKALEDARNTIRSAVNQLSEHDQVGLVLASDKGEVIQGMSASKGLIDAALPILSGRGRANLVSGVEKASDLLSGTTGTAIIVLITNADDVSNTDVAEIVSSAQGIDASIHIVALDGCDESQLDLVAELTGGILFHYSDDVVDGLQNIASTTYLVTYKTPADAGSERSVAIAEDGLTHTRLEFSSKDYQGLLGARSQLPIGNYWHETSGTVEAE